MDEQLINVDPRELSKFESLASSWWDPNGEFRTLHDINPLRLRYIDERAGLRNKTVIDVGCGGGLLAEGMAKMGARVTGIDISEASLAVARFHQSQSGVNIIYIHATPEQFAQDHAAQYEVVTCMELLEHVPDPAQVVSACARLVKPGGQVFFSTINRTPKAFLFAVIGAEYLFNLLPQGTHDYARFVRPAELACWARRSGLTIKEITGMAYNPFTRHCALTNEIDINYLVYTRSTSEANHRLYS